MKNVTGFQWFAGVVVLLFAAMVSKAEIVVDFVQYGETGAPEVISSPTSNTGMNAGAEDGAGTRTEKAKPLRLALDLSDGSHVIGVPSVLSVRIITSYAEMDVEFSKISNIQIDQDDKSASIVFVNGDKLKGDLKVGSIQLQALFGKCTIALEHIVALSVLTDSLDLPVSLRKGLVLYYSFKGQEGGGVVSDKSGRGNHGKVQGAKWTAKGVRGGAYVFNDKNDEITGSDSNLPAGDTARSVSFWFKLIEDQSSVSGGSFVAWGTGQHNQASSVGFDSRVNRYAVCFGQHGAVDVSSKKITQADEWHHAVLVYTGSGKTQFYVDNADHGLQADEIRSPINTVPSGQLRIGASELKGQMGEVMIYDRALSAQEIDQLYKLQKPSFAP